MAVEDSPHLLLLLSVRYEAFTKSKDAVVDFLFIRLSSSPPSDLLFSLLLLLSLLPPSPLFLSQRSFSSSKSVIDTLPCTHTHTKDSQTVNISCLTSSCFWSLYTARLCSSLPLFVCFQARDKRTPCDLWLFILLGGF